MTTVSSRPEKVKWLSETSAADTAFLGCSFSRSSYAILGYSIVICVGCTRINRIKRVFQIYGGVGLIYRAMSYISCPVSQKRTFPYPDVSVVVTRRLRLAPDHAVAAKQNLGSPLAGARRVIPLRTGWRTSPSARLAPSTSTRGTGFGRDPLFAWCLHLVVALAYQVRPSAA